MAASIAIVPQPTSNLSGSVIMAGSLVCMYVRSRQQTLWVCMCQQTLWQAMLC